MFEGHNIVVLDLETRVSADDCRHCGAALEEHYGDGACAPWIGERPDDSVPQFSARGWHNKPALGLSIGCWYDYQDGRMHWFDVHTLEATVQLFVTRQPLLVSFNGISFDFVLMRGLLRKRAEAGAITDGFGFTEETTRERLVRLCDMFKLQCATSYDILAEIWKTDPHRKFERGLNSLDAIAQANGLGAKLSTGAQAPRDWAVGRYADVLNYCADDVYKTHTLFELVCTSQPLLRGDGLPLMLPLPALLEGVPCLR